MVIIIIIIIINEQVEQRRPDTRMLLLASLGIIISHSFQTYFRDCSGASSPGDVSSHRQKCTSPSLHAVVRRYGAKQAG